MKVVFSRNGFAHNSSSEHGIIKRTQLRNIRFSDEQDYEYGWERFLLSDRDQKLKYILTQLVCFFKNKLSYGIFTLSRREINKIIKEKIKSTKLNELFDFPSLDTDFSIDHQSLWNLPVSLENRRLCEISEYVDVDFFYDLTKYLLSDEILIIGGNDNDETPEEYESFEFLADFLKTGGDILSRKDGSGNWILSNQTVGNIILVDFSESASEKLTIPYLVDINISNRCNNQCEFCYRSCNILGQEASIDKIQRSLRFFSEIGVFEFVIGGGDITIHPEDLRILYLMSKYKASCTLHYKSFLKIVNDGRIFQYVKGFKAIAVSITDASIEDVERCVKICNNIRGNISLQIIAEITPIEVIDRLLELRRTNLIQLSILGYKDFGNGIEFRNNNNNFIEINDDYIKKILEFHTVSCDAVFSKKYKDLLLSNDISGVVLSKQDGCCTCFYDAVSSSLQKNSYSKEKSFFPLAEHNCYVMNCQEEKKKEFERIFATF